MRIAVLSEDHKVETRVAATPETVKKYKGLGAEVAVQAGAGDTAGIPDAEFTAAGATIAASAAEAVKDADIVLTVRRPRAERAQGRKARRPRHRDHGSLRRGGRPRGARQGESVGLRHGADAPHHARPGDGRALEPGQPRRLPGRHRRRRGIRQGDADDDDGGRHGAGGARLRHGRGRRGPSGRSPPPAASARS